MLEIKNTIAGMKNALLIFEKKFLSLNFEVERIIDRNTYPILIITHIHITIKVGHLRSDTKKYFFSTVKCVLGF